MDRSSLPEDLDSDRLRKVLHFLAELGQVVVSNTQLQPILDWVVLKTTHLLEADEGCLRLLEGDAGNPGSKTMIRKQSQGIVSGSWPPIVAMSVTGYLLHRGDHIATPDILRDDRFQGLRGVETSIRAMLAVPLRVENRVTGLLAVQPQPDCARRASHFAICSGFARRMRGTLTGGATQRKSGHHRTVTNDGREERTGETQGPYGGGTQTAPPISHLATGSACRASPVSEPSNRGMRTRMSGGVGGG